MYSINCKGKLLLFDKPQVMGIINLTPDSFYKGHLGIESGSLLDMAGKMIEEGAAILDIGGQSTRPGSERIGADEEIKRIIPAIHKIQQHFPGCIISADTYYSDVALAAVEAGASIINDISAGDLDENMLATVADLKVPYICMHMQGTPQTMQQNPVYEDVVASVLDFFIAKTAACKNAGITDIIIDPGFGFGKTVKHNFQLLNQLAAFAIIGKPVLVGLSRKSTIYKTLDNTADEALNGTSVLNTMALMNGASILRVHDVKEAAETVLLYTAYKKASR